MTFHIFSGWWAEAPRWDSVRHRQCHLAPCQRAETLAAAQCEALMPPGQNKKNDNGNAFYESLERVFESCIVSTGTHSAALLPSSHSQTHTSQCGVF